VRSINGDTDVGNYVEITLSESLNNPLSKLITHSPIEPPIENTVYIDLKLFLN
jgi:hypothetical protein